MAAPLRDRGGPGAGVGHEPSKFARLARKHLELVSQATHPVTWNQIGQDQDVPCRLVAEVHYRQARRRRTEQYNPQWAAHGLSLLLEPMKRESERSDLSEIREKLLAMAPTPSIRREWEVIKIPVCFRMHCSNDDTEVVVNYLSILQQRQEGSESPFYADSFEVCNRQCLSTEEQSHSAFVDCDDFLDDRIAVAEAMRAITGASTLVTLALGILTGCRSNSYRARVKRLNRLH